MWFRSCLVAKSCPTLRDSKDCSSTGFPAPHQLLEFVRARARWIRDASNLSSKRGKRCMPLEWRPGPELGAMNNYPLTSAISLWVTEWASPALLRLLRLFRIITHSLAPSLCESRNGHPQHCWGFSVSLVGRLWDPVDCSPPGCSAEGFSRQE